jgi:hypothetical protein
VEYDAVSTDKLLIKEERSAFIYRVEIGPKYEDIRIVRNVGNCASNDSNSSSTAMLTSDVDTVLVTQ